MVVGLLGTINLMGPETVRANGESPYIGEISCGGWNFCPNGWFSCEGQLMPISEHETLFVLIGTTYGGDGQETFALPNLSGRTMLGTGTGAGYTYTQGAMGGTEAVTLTTTQVPSHGHAVAAQAATGASASPTNQVAAGVGAAAPRYVAADPGASYLANPALSSVGSSQPHNNLQPYLTVQCCISLYGIFPNP